MAEEDGVAEAAGMVDVDVGEAVEVAVVTTSFWAEEGAGAGGRSAKTP